MLAFTNGERAFELQVKAVGDITFPPAAVMIAQGMWPTWEVQHD